MSSPNRKTKTENVNQDDYYRQIGSDEAEAAVISNVEQRSRRTTANRDGFRPAVDGERVPLGVETLGHAFSTESIKSESVSFQEAVRRVQKAAKKAHARRRILTSRPDAKDGGHRHRRAHTLLTRIQEDGNSEAEIGGLREDEINLITEFDSDGVSTKDSQIDAARVLQHEDLELRNERLPLLNTERAAYSSVAERQQLLNENKKKQRWKQIRAYLNPLNIGKRICYLLFHSFLTISIPLFCAAWFIFYHLGNPSLDLLPGEATLSWWLNFIGRQLLLLDLARIIQFIVIDSLVLNFKVISKLVGPWVTIFCLQSKGWPFVLGVWGLLDLILLQGDDPFQQHWLYFTGIPIYSTANSGSYILASEEYLRVLIAMVLAGFAASLKRTWVTLYFGRRNFEIYKPKLEEILDNIIIVSEIAELAAAANLLSDEGEDVDTEGTSQGNLQKGVRWSSVKFKQTDLRSDSQMSEADESSVGSDEECANEGENEGFASSSRHQDWLSSEDTMSERSNKLNIKYLLDRWDEPLNKQNKSVDSTIEDILTFRKALTYMDLQHPFSEAFGSASTRDELIVSAERVYTRLLKLSPNSSVLPAIILSAIIDNDDGSVDKRKKRRLNNLFRADINGQITKLSFIQACDNVYKKLRFFRASVGNSSVIDKVLENIIDAVGGFILGLLILSLLKFNPWPLLVSISTLLVTLAFAVGPSAAKSVEGILLIVGQRPYDIGDRITIANSPGADPNPITNSWLVDDITLFTTTLRFGSSNEVATVSNGSLTNARITNCARSKNANAVLVLKLHINLHQGDNVDQFKRALETYIQDKRDVWEQLLFFRCEDIDTDNEFVVYKLGVRSRQTWQVLTRILEDRARLHQFCIETAEKLHVEYDIGAPRRVLYYGGNLVEGHVSEERCKKDLLSRQNIRSGSGLGSMLKSLEDDNETK